MENYPKRDKDYKTPFDFEKLKYEYNPLSKSIFPVLSKKIDDKKIHIPNDFKQDTINLQMKLMESSPIQDMSNIREEDRPYIHEVIQYLRQNGLKTKLCGSANYSKLYGDVDILATGSLEDVLNTVHGFNRVPDNENANPFYTTAADDEEYQVVDEGKGVFYMNEKLAQLFNIIVGKTNIHVGLKAEPVSRNKFHY